MTKKEAAIVSAYTGLLVGSFSDMHEYVEAVLGRPVWTHEMADPDFVAELKKATKKDFVTMTITD